MTPPLPLRPLFLAALLPFPAASAAADRGNALAMAPSATPAAPASMAGDVSVPELLELGRAAELRGDAAEALKNYTLVLTKDPSNGDAAKSLRRAGLLLGERSRKETNAARVGYVREARRNLELAASRQTRLSVRYDQGRRFLAAGDLLKASDVLNGILEEEPGHQPARKRMARLQRAIEKRINGGRFPSPRHQAAAKGVYLYNAGQWEKACQALDEALAGGDLPQDLADARVADYAALARKRCDQDKWDAERTALLAGAKSAYESGRIKDSRAALKTVLSRAPADAQALELLAAVDKMAEGLETSVRKEARLEEIPERLSNGTLLYIQRRYADALEEFTRVLELDPDNAEAREQIREVRKALKQEGISLPDLSGAGTAEKRYKEGLRLYGDERYQEAETAFKEALRLDPDHQDARQTLERLQEQSGKKK